MGWLGEGVECGGHDTCGCEGGTESARLEMGDHKHLQAVDHAYANNSRLQRRILGKPLVRAEGKKCKDKNNRRSFGSAQEDNSKYK